MGRIWLLWGCIICFLYVGLGAFGAHALKEILTSEKMATLAIANQYMGFHGLALLALGLWNHWEKWSTTLWAGGCFLFGIIFFSGSLYIYVLLELKTAARITPVGGGLFLLGWLLFSLSVIRTKNNII
jgi:uncharacterized membrane protein YgdD (TMEM256/DUF423 family)